MLFFFLLLLFFCFFCFFFFSFCCCLFSIFLTGFEFKVKISTVLNAFKIPNHSKTMFLVLLLCFSLLHVIVTFMSSLYVVAWFVSSAFHLFLRKYNTTLLNCVIRFIILEFYNASVIQII